MYETDALPSFYLPSAPTQTRDIAKNRTLSTFPLSSRHMKQKRWLVGLMGVQRATSIANLGTSCIDRAIRHRRLSRWIALRFPTVKLHSQWLVCTSLNRCCVYTFLSLVSLSPPSFTRKRMAVPRERCRHGNTHVATSRRNQTKAPEPTGEILRT